jgi:hypothetical protein
MTTDNFCFYLQNRLIKPVKQEVNGTVILPPLVFPDKTQTVRRTGTATSKVEKLFFNFFSGMAESANRGSFLI